MLLGIHLAFQRLHAHILKFILVLSASTRLSLGLCSSFLVRASVRLSWDHVFCLPRSLECIQAGTVEEAGSTRLLTRIGTLLKVGGNRANLGEPGEMLCNFGRLLLGFSWHLVFSASTRLSLGLFLCVSSALPRAYPWDHSCALALPCAYPWDLSCVTRASQRI